MVLFTGAEYLMIDLANAYGMDKELFPKRIEWARTTVIPNILDESFIQGLADDADEPILLIKAVRAIRSAMAGESIGHLVELDATTSGPQIMSALTCDLKGGVITNLIDPSKRYDCYLAVYEGMCKVLGITDAIDRKVLKNAVMCCFYGSKAEPINAFGEDTPELAAFYQVMQEMLPGAWDCREDLIDLWQAFTLAHDFTLPDGYLAHIPVITKKKVQIEVDELDHHKFTHMFFENKGMAAYVSLAANVIHGVDGYMVREMGRRCNYDHDEIVAAQQSILAEIKLRGGLPVGYKYNPSNIVSMALIYEDMDSLTLAQLVGLSKIIEQMLERQSFDLVCIHDA